MDSAKIWSMLRGKGLRMTPLKKKIVELFLGGACGLSAADVKNSIGENPHISSVHRCLSSLEKAGFLRLDRNDDGVLRYRCSRTFYPDHGHFRCMDCGKRFPVRYTLPEDFVKKLEASGDFMVEGSDLLLEGKCCKCALKLN